MIDEEPPQDRRVEPPSQVSQLHVTLDLGELADHLGALIERLATPSVLGTIEHTSDCGHRELLISADTLCSLVLYRETRGLSNETRTELSLLVTKLREATKALGG